MVTPFTPRAAADGVDEWLMIASARARVPDGGGRTLSLVCTDTDDTWLVSLDTDGLEVSRGAAPADCSVSAPAGDLFALVMNRAGSEGLAVDGDSDVLRAWHTSVRF